MRKIYAKFGAAVMMAVILTVILGVDGKPASKTLVVAIDFTQLIFVKPGFTSGLDKGVRTYQEFALLDKVGGTTIGVYRFHGVSTLAVGSGAGWYGNESFEIFGVGVIEGISRADQSISLFPVGSIIGGTERFSGAAGEYTSSDFATYTFTFERAR